MKGTKIDSQCYPHAYRAHRSQCVTYCTQDITDIRRCIPLHSLTFSILHLLGMASAHLNITDISFMFTDLSSRFIDKWSHSTEPSNYVTQANLYNYGDSMLIESTLIDHSNFFNYNKLLISARLFKISTHFLTPNVGTSWKKRMK